MFPNDDVGRLFAEQLAELNGMADVAAAIKRVTAQIAPPPMLDFSRLMPKAALAELFKNISEMSEMTSITSGFFEELKSMSELQTNALAGLKELYSPNMASLVGQIVGTIAPTFPIVSLESFNKAGLSRIADLYKGMGIASAKEREPASRPFAAEEFRAIAEVGDAETVDAIEQRFQQIESEIVNRIKQTPALKISFEGWVNLLLTIFIFLYGTVSSEKFQTRIEKEVGSIERIDRSIVESQKRIYQALIQHVAKDNNAEAVYTVERKVVLRARPTAKAQSIGVLVPGQLVMREDAKGKWLHVTYFDYDDATIQTGWVLKKYLKLTRN
jgi:hypothetical protein